MEHPVVSAVRKAIEHERTNVSLQILQGVTPEKYLNLLSELRGLDRAEGAAVAALKKDWQDEIDA